MAKYKDVLIGPSDFDDLRCDLDREPDPDPGSRRTTDEDLDAALPEDGNISQLVVKTVLLLVTLSITSSGGLGLVTNNWAPLQAVWNIVAAPLGGLFDRYVGKARPSPQS